jgi:nicotinate phosphoribosyltransferase
MQSTVQNPTPEDLVVYDWMNPLLTDHYQITMAYAYWRNKRHNEHAVFEAFFRKNPFKGTYTIFAGLDEVMKFIQTFKFTADHINYLRTQLKQAPNEFFEWLEAVDTSKIKVYGFKDGHLCFPR